MKKIKLNLGCGDDYRCNYLNVDKADVPKDYDYDLDEYPWPFQDDQYIEVLAYHVLEHLKSPYKAMKEIIRISKNGAKVKVRFPLPKHANMTNDPTHKYPLTPKFFELLEDIEIVDVNKKFPWPHNRYELIDLFIYHKLGYEEYKIELKVKKES